ncbi:Transcriptional regulatory protein, C terminal [Actinokineospora alba]|uniref:Transcriptional regulatory protein, C terminal n=1 Tax=Actinokineospora alba TaxID=504798 RepID=A0A1H0F4W6_9PSEU|nr:BTAD domain-containing putative transcriptional regulator [Actinokineospora alba]TDP69341.1 transcriptional regulator [Actinokineospora alba]SDI18866.1 Transcriptional regulatory protein, C terminal [Actinokineospora alba]SDN89688.1 Transcriptional regulatory protein, C terminal [Actinokineospora alba]
MAADLDIGAAAAWLDRRRGPRAATRPAFLEPPPPRPGQFRAVDEDTGAIGVPTPSGFRRGRLLDHCVSAHTEGSVIVTGPPGAGKTELVAQFAEHLRERGEKVGWLGVDGSLCHPRQVVEGVADALLGTSPHHHQISVRRLAAEVGRTIGPCTLVVDDAHLLTGQPAVVLGRVINALSRDTRFVLAARTERAEWSTPVRLAGHVHSIDGQALRFREDEVESLFREHYDAPLTQAAVSELTERTEGWIMAIHLFQAATRGHSPEQRAAAIATLAGSRLLRHHLTATVLADLPSDTVDLLLFSSACTPVVPEWCDALLDRSNSGWTLDQLVEQNLLVRRDIDGDQVRYRYHPLFQAHLVAELRARISPEALREHYRKIARLHESVGRDHEALVAYLRAADVRASSRILNAPRTGQASLMAGHRHDVGAVLLAQARARALNDQLDAALAAYQEATTALAGTDLHEDCVREQELVAAFSPGAPPTDTTAAHWLGQLRRALDKRPAALAEHPMADTSDGWSLAAGIASLLDGRPTEAVRHWSRILPTRTDVIGLLGTAVRVVADNWTKPDAMAPALEALAAQAEGDFLDAVGAVVRALSALSGVAAHIENAERIESLNQDERPWVSLVGCVAAAIGRCRSGVDAVKALHRCERRAASLQAAAVATWARVIMAGYLADPGSAELDQTARGAGDATVSPAGRHPLSPAVQRSPAAPARIAPLPTSTVATPRPGPDPRMRIRCFGQFEIAVGDQLLDWRGLRPRVQSVLRLLALRANRGVHVDTLYQCFWPGAPLDSARRSLHVAVSMIRRVLGDAPAPSWPQSPVERRGDMYVLAIPPGGTADTVRFGEALHQWRVATGNADPTSLLKPLRTAFSLYTGDLLPEEGAAEWVLADRARYRALVLDVACALARIEVKLGNPGRAAAVCTRAIEIDRFHDPAWNLLIHAYQLGNEPAAAHQARSQYRDVLAELGVHEPPEQAPRKAPR